MRAFIIPVISVVLFFFATASAVCQRANRIMVGVQADFIKSDNNGLIEKMQGGFEGSFYPGRKVAVTTGIEWWTGDDFPVALLGARFCPIDEAFIRLRWLVNNDASIGAGFAKPLTANLRLEAMADYYFNGQIAIRGGIAYGFGGNP